MQRLEGKVALVTGGARGQGEAEARLFASEGAQVVVADVLDEAGEKVAAEIGDAAIYRHLDVSSEADWTKVVDDATRAFGKLDVLVNNAAIFRTGLLEKMSLADYMDVVHVNQVGVFLGMRTVVPAMRAAGGGSIVNISSTGGLEGVEGMVGYTATKWAVRGMTKTAALELGQYGIRVNSVHPGGVDTPMLKGEEMQGVDQEASYASHPIARIGQPIEIARMVLFLASDEGSYCTGAEFAVDGGRMAGHRDPGIAS